jgi:transcription elongation factor Elf1
MFESGNEERKRISDLIIARYRPICNEEVKEVKPDYKIRQKSDTQKISCPCCGSEMKVDQVLEKSTIIRCTECGISDTRLNS